MAAAAERQRIVRTVLFDVQVSLRLVSEATQLEDIVSEAAGFLGGIE